MPAFAVTTEQQDLRASVRRFLADLSPEAEVRRLMDTERGYDPDVWKRMARRLGLQGLGIPEEFGGSGAGHVELGIVFEEMGRALLCAPFLSTVGLAANLLLASGDRDARQRYLPGIAEGGVVATVAVSVAGPPGAGVTARRTDDGWRLSGVEPYVLDGHVADVVFVPARSTSGVELFAVEGSAAGLGRTLLTTVDRTRKQARLTFVDTPGAPLGGGLAALGRMLDLAAVALASEQAGGAARALEMSVGYARTRVQFGRAIGSFQAIKHLCADLLLESESATSAARYAASAADEDAADLPALASLTRSACSDSFSKVAADTIQIHGGIGFTWEHPAHLYLRRARTSAQLLGDPAYHREQYLRRAAAHESGSPATRVATRAPASRDEKPGESGSEAARVGVSGRAGRGPGPGSADLRREVAAWLAAEWDPARPKQEWLAAVVEAGWAAPRWPREWFGRGLTDDDGHVVEEEFRRAGAPGTGQDRHNLYAATVLAFGGDELKHRFIGPMLRDEVTMCLLYSEPNAGSDLAAVRTRADRDGERWIVNGQKVWTSSAAKADHGMLVARTNWDVPKHRGITFFLFPMKQDGVEVRPLRQITGESHFNEVFLTDAAVPDTHRLGEVDRGWGVLQTALAYERSVMGDRARTGRVTTGMAEMGDELVALARETGRIDDPVIRQDLARVAGLRLVNGWNNQRAKAEVEQGSSSSVMSLGKLAMSRLLHESARVRTALAGPRAMLEGPDEPVGDEANFLAFNAYFTSIGGGTDQIQRTIIGERILGLPKEPEIDRDLPFSEVRRG